MTAIPSKTKDMELTDLDPEKEEIEKGLELLKLQNRVLGKLLESTNGDSQETPNSEKEDLNKDSFNQNK